MTKDFSRLSGKIVEKYGTQYNFAIAIGLSERSLSQKLNNRVGWRDEEIERAIQLLGLDINDIPAYFFTKVVQVFWANFVGKEDGMRPRIYPYSGKIKKPINFQIDLEKFKHLSYEAIHDTSQVTQ